MERSMTMVISCQGVCVSASYDSDTIECICMRFMNIATELKKLFFFSFLKTRQALFEGKINVVFDKNVQLLLLKYV